VTTLSVATSAVAVAAALYDGLPAADVDLNDGSVWVTNSSQLLLGRLNRQIDELTSGVRTLGSDFDVLQNGSTVLLHDAGAGTLETVDVAYSVLTGKTALPPDADVALGGQTVAVLRRDTGAVRIVPAGGVASLDVEADEPDLELGRGALVTVGVDGTVHAVSTQDGELVDVATDDGAVVDETRPERPDLPRDVADVDLSAVGERAVVLDRARDRLLTADEQTELDVGPDAVLQQPGPESEQALVATGRGLLGVPLDGGEVRRDDAGGSGVPARPVLVAGCAHAAWSGAGTYLRRCGGDAAEVRDVPGITADARLRFRVNRDVVVLNDLVTGTVWLVDENMQVVDNWTDVTPPEEEDDTENEDALEEQVQDVQAQRTEENRPPVAVDDELGVRPGRTTVLPVLANDTDPDGDLLTVTAEKPSDVVDSVAPVAGGTALQVSLPPEASGATAFTYTADDGRGGTAEATVRLAVRPYDVNAPPEQRRRTTAVVEQGGQVTVPVLGDWLDPDGDDLVLVAASATTGDTVRFRADGSVTFIDAGTQVGRKEVTLQVSDGRETAQGTLVVDVRPAGQLPPVAVTDHVEATAGAAVTVKPLANDTDPNGDPLRLSRVDELPDGAVVPDYAAGTFSFTAPKPGTYYLTYVATDGPNSAVGLIRVDVTAAATQNRPPVAVRDLALLPTGEDVLVDVLVNDEDPDGDVLVVQRVDGAADAGLTVAVLEHRLLRISARRALDTPVVVTYTVSDGQASSAGSVVVVPVSRSAQQQPPVAQPDEATVRAGDVVTIPVLDNDSHPDGDDLVLDRELAESPSAGLLFVDGATLRYQAPTEPGTYTAVYTVRDSLGQAASTQVTLYVRPADEQNSPPQPRPLVARATAGTTVRIPVPVLGIDPDGDSVTVTGVDSAPAKGRVVDSGPNWLQYEAFSDSSGTDTFTYAVVDRLGARAVAAIRVGIAPPAPRNQPPVAVDDVVVVRPDRRVAAPVLANDSDPDGDRLAFADPALQPPAGVSAAVDAERVEVAVPGGEGTTTIPYSIVDGRGGQATAFLTIEARDDAPLLAPLARDDVLAPADVLGRGTVDVPVLDNDEDPDGTRADLRVAVHPSAAGAAPVVGEQLRVRVAPERQLLAYSVTDADGGVGYAFVVVPGTADTPPSLDPDAPPLEVVTGQPLDIDLTERVLVADGRTPRITTEERVRATNADGSPLVTGPTTLRFVSAAGYVGPASVTVEVTDGSGPDDPAGRTAVLTLPITVLPAENQPPTFAGARLQVAPGEAPVTLDLRSAVRDPDPGDLDRLVVTGPTGVPAGLQASIDGTVLSVAAEASTPKGTSATLQVTVSDGVNPPVAGSVVVDVVPSTRPLAKAVDDVVPAATQGEPVDVPVLANDSNPIPDEPLRLVSAVLETGSGTAAAHGDSVRVTPAADFVGTMVVRYTVTDATGDPDRQVDGRVLVTVRGRPAAPAAPTVLEVRDHTVVLQWQAPASNGAPILDYEVTADGYSRTCPGTTCTLDDLTNDVEYRFRVTARNEVGTSDLSPPSAPARPDVKPDRPNPPTLEFGDGYLDISWTAPRSPGSPIESYDLEISPPAGGTTSVTVTGTSYRWTGLTNGQSYQVRVRANNRAPDPSDWSDYSRPEVPAGVPARPAAPTAENSGGTLGGQVTVRWRAPAANGDPISSYSLRVYKNGSLTQTLQVDGGTTTQTISAENASEYTFRVSARNKAGDSPVSASSAPVTPFGQPGQVGSVSADERDRASKLTFTAPSDNGQAIRKYQYRVNGGGAQDLPSDRVVRGLTNGDTYRFEVRACNTYCGDWSPQSNAVKPYGPVREPSVQKQANAKSVTFSWQAPAPNGRAIDHIEIRIDNKSWQNKPNNGSVEVGNGYNQTHTIDVRAVDTVGQKSSIVSRTATSKDAPAPTINVVQNRRYDGRWGSCSGSCWYMDFSYSNLPRGTYTVKWIGKDGQFYSKSLTLGGQGTYQATAYYGYAGTTVRVDIGPYRGNSYTWKDK
jgi:hypothetical protein